MSDREAKSSPTPRTISVVDEDELQIHKLYRERIVQEDNIINHRMMWMVLTQAFLLATFGALAQKIYSQTRRICLLRQE